MGTAVKEVVKMADQTKQTHYSKRLQQILVVFRKYNVVHNLTKQEDARAVCEAFEELGPTFVKIGQMLSVRTDIFDQQFANGLRKLQNQVKIDEFVEVQKLVEEELGKKIDDLFQEFAHTPMASASIGQVHRAVLPSGEAVVVKVQHPGIANEIESDIRLFKEVLKIIRYVPESRIFNLKQIVEELQESLLTELDFTKERIATQKFYQLNNGWKAIRSPKVYPNYCSQKILTLEYLSGESIQVLLDRNNSEQVSDELSVKEQKEMCSRLLVEHFMKEVFIDGFFHGDPHPGNILIHSKPTKPADITFDAQLKGKKSIEFQTSIPQKEVPFTISFIDFGITGVIDSSIQTKIMDLFQAIYTKDSHRITKVVLGLTLEVGAHDDNEFQSELTKFLDQYLELAAKDIDLKKVLAEIFKICQRNNLQIDSSILLLVKAFGILEGVIQELTPDISLFDLAKPFIEKYFLMQFDLKEELKKSAFDYYKATKNLPQLSTRTLEALDTIVNGKLKVTMELKNQKNVFRTIENIVTEAVIGLLVSALVIGSSLLLQTDDHPVITFLGIAGYSAAFLFILVMCISILYRKFKK